MVDSRTSRGLWERESIEVLEVTTKSEQSTRPWAITFHTVLFSLNWPVFSMVSAGNRHPRSTSAAPSAASCYNSGYHAHRGGLNNLQTSTRSRLCKDVAYRWFGFSRFSFSRFLSASCPWAHGPRPASPSRTPSSRSTRTAPRSPPASPSTRPTRSPTPQARTATCTSPDARPRWGCRSSPRS